MTRNRIDMIRERKLSNHELKRMAAIAGEETDPEEPSPAPQEKPAALDSALNNPATVNKIEELASQYYENFEKKYGDNTASVLAAACLNMEGAVLIAKAIREYKWSEVKKP